MKLGWNHLHQNFILTSNSCIFNNSLTCCPCFQLQAKASELHKFVYVAAPFGTPIDTSITTIQALINNKDINIPQKGKVRDLGKLQNMPISIINSLLLSLCIFTKMLILLSIVLFMKQPAWKPVQHKGKQQLTLNVREEIRAAQVCSAVRMIT